MTVVEEIMKELDDVRKRNNLTWQEIADSIGISKRQLLRVRKGECPMTVDTLCDIARTLNVSIKFDVLWQ